jgi:hypothetical protein
MDKSIMGTLEERRCAALADFYLGQVAPNDETAHPLKLTSLDDLYEYLLLDSQVGQELETSSVAEGLACLQQYIGAIYGGLEAGHNTAFSKDELEAWHQRYSNISDWAGYEMLKEYPENWIDPTLRLHKSESFEELENNLSQASLSDKAVQTALFEHLRKFEEVCDLKLISGYINSVAEGGTGKGQNFRNADYYFLGQQTVQPFDYFWRKAHVEVNANSTFLSPAVWTEWKPVGVPKLANQVAVQPVFFAGRLMLVQVEAIEFPTQESEWAEAIIRWAGFWKFEVTLSYLGLNGMWTTPIVLARETRAVGAYTAGAPARLVAVNYAGAKPSEDRLQVCFDPTETVGDHAKYVFASINALFEPAVPDKDALIELLDHQFVDQMLMRHNSPTKGVVTPAKVPRLSRQASGAQFLDVETLNIAGLKWIRLNSLFGPELVALASISIDEVLSLATQNILEPQPEGVTPVTAPIDFNSAHGYFYWELFFHLPFLVAHRLREERNYLESQRWFHYIFNPHIRTPREGQTHPSDRYWLCRPLLEPGDIGFEAKGLVDPDAIAFANRIHYRKAIFMGYVRCIIAHADAYYRRLTRDGLVAAKQQYVRALSLMGPAPKAKAMSHWVPQSAEDILKPPPAESLSSLNAFAGSLSVDVANLPARVVGTPDFEILGLDVFRPYTNDHLLNTWKYLDECLWNMRHNLTIDGKVMNLALYAPPTEPLDLMRAQAGGASGAMRNAGGWKTIPHYRFRPLLATAQNAVQTLIGFGREVRQLMELRDRGQLEELQQSHVIALGAHAKTIQEETIKQQEASLDGLKQSQKTVQERVEYYKQLHQKALLVLEGLGDALSMTGKVTSGAASVPIVAGALVDMSVMNTFGMANGGFKLGASAKAVGTVLGLSAGVAFATSEGMQRTAFYKRREQEWDHAQRQAESELQVLQEQTRAQQHGLNAARAHLAQTQKANDQAQEIYAFYKSRATNVELYRWLLGQMATLYFQAYDAVVGLCLNAETSFQYEMGDFDTQVIRPNVWMDHRHGLSAGESMSLDLLRLERMYLERAERRLELTKTLSLRQFFEQGEFTLAKTWENVIDELKAGKLDFEFSQRMFDSDYPGHYCRQIVAVSVTFPAVLHAYQDMHVTLTQTGSTTVHKADVDALDYLYGEGEDIPPAGIFLNPRVNQQVGLSQGVDDFGLHQMMFGDERYLPFEGTGALSKWRLEFPRSRSVKQARVIDTLTDIIVHVRYLAKVGGTAYTTAVLERLEDDDGAA